ncbi:hypothetical protein JCM10213_008864 [Rhodosporidiobolus nylandii]
MSSPSRNFDLLVFGASGFTGQLVCQYLQREAEKEGFTFAVAGRNREKVVSRMKEVGAEPVEVVVADATDEAAIREAVKRTKVVISLVGPYLQHGDTLVKVVAEEGVHYVDLTGEAPFVSNCISRYSESALRSKAIILHSCGFDSVPSDLSTFLAVQRLKELGGAGAGRVRSVFAGKGGVSGGTTASMLGLFEADKEERRVAGEPYALSPIHASHRPRPILFSTSTYAGRSTVGAFWAMGPFNSQIVRRSWGLLQSASDPAAKNLAYGERFEYDENMKMGSKVGALLASVALYVGFLLILLPPARWLLKRYGPKSGDGPSKEDQKSGWFEVETIAKSWNGSWESRCKMRGEGDPGYSATALLISSCALSLLKDHDRLPSLARQGGFLTPATALGPVLVERLEKTGKFTFEVEGGTVAKGK